MKETVEQLASRLLRMHDRGELRMGCKHYFSLLHGQSPSWWTPDFAATYPDALGVYENRTSLPTDVIIFRSSSITVLSTPSVFIQYGEIGQIGALSKEMPNMAIQLRLLDARVEFIPVLRVPNDSFTIVRFLYQARGLVLGDVDRR